MASLFKRAAATCALALAACVAQAVPSTFSPVIGSALLCRSQLDNVYFYAYLTAAFGPSYKHEGGAYWFKTDAALWGTPVSEVMVSDDSAQLNFIAAVTDTTPALLNDAIRSSAGVQHLNMDSSAWSPLESQAGSRIVYFKDKSKIYCARFKQQPSGR